MRCSCRVCGEYMIQAEELQLGCICPNCLNRCTDCLGNNTRVISKEDIKKLDPFRDLEDPGD